MSDRKRAREEIENRLGRSVAEKATDEFCLSFTRRTRRDDAGLEAFGSPAAPSAVVEFNRDPEAIARRASMLDDHPSVTRALEAFREMSTAALELAMPRPVPPRRERLIQFERDAFLRDAQMIRAEVQRAAQASGVDALRGGVETDVQLCWLNRTMLVRSNPASLAQAAADPLIRTLDVPRLLEKEIDVSASTVNAVGYRNRHGLSGLGIIVAVLDSEVAIGHPAFSGRVIQRKNYTNESWGTPDDHGTAVAGIIGSSDGSYPGIAPDVTLYNYKVLATQNRLNATDFGGALALQQALEDGAHIANCSWGAGLIGPVKSREAVACDTAWALGMVIVKSAGNYGPDPDTMTTPADADGIIVVAATDGAGASIQRYSSRGNGTRNPHMAAPGGAQTGRGIFSCLVGGGFGDCTFGTSFAAPNVSGLCALLLQQRPALDPDAVRNFLLGSCRQIAGFGTDAQGAGLVVLP